VGVTPGPRMMTEHLPLALTLLLGNALANIIGGIICLVATPHLVKVASLHLDFMLPGVLIAAFIGVYVATLSPPQFITVLAFALLGLAMKRFDYSRPALLLGFVLGGMFENYSLLSIKIYGPLFFLRPIPLILVAVMVILLVYPYLTRLLSRLRRGRKGA